MADTKAAPTNKMALSRALGAAFLNHQVQQLEKSVNIGPGSGNWRDRRQTGAGAHTLPGGMNRPRAEGANHRRIDDSPPKGTGRDRHNYSNLPRDQGRRRSSDDSETKDADVVVVDASVLVHALYQVKKWCRDGREEVVIVPLEALNTLDLLKKGTTPLAQRARAASRILEAQVGTNPRICVQRDDAFILWDKIAFSESPESADLDARKPVNPSSTSPEWVRRTISCARWEVENASHDNHNELKAEHRANATNGHNKQLKVVLAVLSSQSSLSPRTAPAKLVDTAPETPLVPIPLPLSSFQHANKHELRSSGTLVAHWAARAGIQLLEVGPTAPAPAASTAGRVSEEDERNKRSHHHGPSHSHGSRGRRLSHGTGDGNGRVGLVERPPAVKAMMDMVAQPTRVVRVLARGEKLDPDP